MEREFIIEKEKDRRKDEEVGAFHSQNSSDYHLVAIQNLLPLNSNINK